MPTVKTCSMCKTCPMCKTTFVKSTAGDRPQIYCSRTCMQRAQNIKRAIAKRIGQKGCIMCGKTYLLGRYSGGRKVCSDECASLRKIQLNALRPKEQPKHPKTCIGCGKAYWVTSAGKDRQYCNRACYFEHRPPPAYAGNYTRPVFAPRDCVMCGKSYVPTVGHQKLCGEPCKSRGNKATQAAWWRRNRDARAKYRSPEWRAEAAQRKQDKLAAQAAAEEAAARADIRTCLWCGDDFEGDIDDTYCSDDCQWDDAAEQRKQGAR